MSQAFTADKLSGSTNGKGILVTGTATASSVTIHAAVAGTSSLDEVWIYATNSSAAAVELTIEWGETTASMNKKYSVPSKNGEKLIIPGFKLNNSLVVKAFAATADVISISGWVNHIV